MKSHEGWSGSQYKSDQTRNSPSDFFCSLILLGCRFELCARVFFFAVTSEDECSFVYDALRHQLPTRPYLFISS
jgi:hypothetical protein